MKKRCLQCMNEFDAEYNICPHCGYAADSTDRGTDHIKTGSVIQNRYLIGKVLGSGGFGITYVAWDNNLEEKVAIKEYFPRDLSSRVANTNEVVSISEEKGEMYNAGLRKFIEEARLLAKFKAVDGIVNVENYFEENNTAYIVMEFAEGITLKEYLKSRGRLTDSETIKLMLPIMSSLEQIHKRGIIHRDISPDNIMINGEKIKLLDFGAARFATGEDNRSLSIVLKHGYAPEEQYRTKGVQGAWTDIYSLCATMYKCITGTVPDESFERILDDTLKAPSELGIYINPNLERVIMKGLNVKAADRYQSITEMVADLNAEDDEELAETVALNFENEENITESFYPEAAVKQKKTNNKTAIIVASSVCICLAFLIVLATVIIPSLAERKNVVENSSTIVKPEKEWADIDNNLAVGDTVKFGAYEQDNNTSNGKEDIGWIVLAKENEKALLISEYVLDCQLYNLSFEEEEIIWDGCCLRTWLNDTFLNSAFSSDEQVMIAVTNVCDDENSAHPVTNDKIFLLSRTEAEKYFTSVESRRCSATVYAEKQGTPTNDNFRTESDKTACSWWLRTPDNYSYNNCLVDFDGDVIHDVVNADGNDSNGVRPTLWINLES